MSRWDTFTFRVNTIERHLIAELAVKLQRSQSDAVRFIVVNAARELTADEKLGSEQPTTCNKGVCDGK